MYREMRRTDRKMNDGEALRVLNAAEWGVLSLTAGGLPYGVPLSHAVSGRTIYFHCAAEGQKLKFMRENPKGCFTVVTLAETVPGEGTVRYESAMAFGPVRVVADPAERASGFDALIAKFVGDAAFGRSLVDKYGEDALVVALDAERVTGKGAR